MMALDLSPIFHDKHTEIQNIQKIIIYKYEIFGTFRAIIKMTLMINTSKVG
jgi:hypothetical protein